MSTEDTNPEAPTRTVLDVLDEEQLADLAELNGLREARRALRDRGGERP